MTAVTSQQALAALQAAREGTGVAFPAAVAAHARARPDAALADARAWCASPDPGVRLVGLEVLAALAHPHGGGGHGEGHGEGPEAGDGVRGELARAAAAAARDEDPELRWSAAKALGRLGTAAVADLAVLARDEDADVRWQAVSSLPLAAGSPPDERAVGALVAATADAEDDVADHAVFALGLQLDVDAPAVREALAVHLRDGQRGRPDTAAQAALALAQREDPRAGAAVVAALGAALAGTEDDLAELEEDWTAAAQLLAGTRPDVAAVLAEVGARREGAAQA